jgi:hypothetical protein
MFEATLYSLRNYKDQWNLLKRYKKFEAIIYLIVTPANGDIKRNKENFSRYFFYRSCFDKHKGDFTLYLYY